MSLSISLMCHPRRGDDAAELSAQLDAPILWDRYNDVWDTGRRSLLAHADWATHHLVLQDDAIIPPNLYETCEQILDHTPSGAPVSLYMGRWRHRPRRYSMKPVVQAARKVGASFAVFGGPWWGVGVIVPTADIEDIVVFGNQPGTHPNYDIKIAQFYKSKGVPCWYTMPSVIDHREGKSLVGPRGAKRHAQWYEQTADKDWGGPVIRPDDMDLKRPFPRTP